MSKKKKVIVLNGKREIKVLKANETKVGLNTNIISMTLVK